ncbi:MAG: hypothetical protein AAFV69_03715 [Pseudomonadota bacterium]
MTGNKDFRLHAFVVERQLIPRGRVAMIWTEYRSVSQASTRVIFWLAKLQYLFGKLAIGDACLGDVTVSGKRFQQLETIGQCLEICDVARRQVGGGHFKVVVSAFILNALSRAYCDGVSHSPGQTALTYFFMIETII